MIAALRGFFDSLREAGVRSSTAERLDALRAVEAVGPERREAVKRALRATLVKHAAQRPIFDAVFERYFAPPRRGGGRGEGRPSAGGPVGGRIGGRGRPLAPTPSRTPAPPSKRGEGGGPVKGDRLVKRRLAELREGGRERWGRLRHVAIDPPRGASRAERPAVERLPLRQLRRRPSADPRQAELARAVRRLVERIRLGTGRRVERASRGRPHLRRLFRESLRTDGVPFRIPQRRHRERTPRVWLLIDVSWSTARAAGLFLQMAGEFLRLGRQTRVVLFVDRPVDATERVATWLERGRPHSFERLLRDLAELNPDAPSDYGRTFHRLLVSPRRPRGRRTLLLVLGDGRTNRFDEQAWALEELAEGCGAALWLVPEPVSSWGTGDSALGSYLPSMDTVVEAEDLEGLARGVSRLLRRL